MADILPVGYKSHAPSEVFNISNSEYIIGEGSKGDVPNTAMVQQGPRL